MMSTGVQCFRDWAFYWPDFRLVRFSVDALWANFVISVAKIIFIGEMMGNVIGAF